MGFLTGFASGAFQAANNEFAQQDNTVATQMKQRAALTDQLADQYQKNQDKINATKTLQTSIMTNYNVDPDTAYTAANNPAFGKMHPMDQQDYIKSLKPVQGKMTPATGGPQAPVLPATQVPGVRLGPFTLPGKTLPAVSAPPTPVDPGHQMFESVGFDPEKRAKALAAVSDVKNWQTPNDDGTTSTDVDLHKQAMDAYDKRDYNTTLTLQSQVKGKAGGAGSADKAFAQAAGLIGNGTVNVEDRDAVAAAYSGLGGKDPQAVDRLMTMYHKSGVGSTNDPIFEKKLENQRILIQRENKTWTPEQVDQAARKIVGGNIKIDTANQSGAIFKTDTTPGVGEPVQTMTTTGLSPETQKQAQVFTAQAPMMLNSINSNIKELEGHPGAVGYKGALSEFFGQHGYNLAQMANQPDLAKKFDSWIGLSENAPYRAQALTLLATMARPLLGTSRPGLDERQMIEDVIGKHNIDMTFPQIMSALHTMKDRYLEQIAFTIKHAEGRQIDPYLLRDGEQAPAGLPQGRQAINAGDYSDQIGERYNLEPDDADQVVRIMNKYQRRMPSTAGKQ